MPHSRIDLPATSRDPSPLRLPDIQQKRPPTTGASSEPTFTRSSLTTRTSTDLRPLSGAVMAMSGAVDAESVVSFSDGDRRYTLTRSPTDNSLQLSDGELHLSLSTDKDVPIEVDGAAVDEDNAAHVAAILRVARQRLVEGLLPAASGTARRSADAAGAEGSVAYRYSSAPSPLANAEYAVIPKKVLTRYALNTEHPVGRIKAAEFQTYLNFRQDNADKLEALIRKHILKATAVLTTSSRLEERYRVDLHLMGQGRHSGEPVVLRTCWQYLTGSANPRLVTLFLRTNERAQSNGEPAPSDAPPTANPLRTSVPLERRSDLRPRLNRPALAQGRTLPPLNQLR